MSCHGISEAIENLSLSESLGARPKVNEKTEEKQSRRRNRKDKRRAGLEDSDNSKPPPMSRVEKLRAERQRCSLVSEPSRRSPGVGSVSLATEIKNLPESFFSDSLEAERSEASEGKDLKKRRRRRQKRKQSSTEEEDKLCSENIEEEKLNDKLIDDEPGEQIVTNFGDEQCVVSRLFLKNFLSYSIKIFPTVQLEERHPQWRH